MISDDGLPGVLACFFRPMRERTMPELTSDTDLKRVLGEARTSTRTVWQLDNRWLMRMAPDFGREAAGDNEEAADQQS